VGIVTTQELAQKILERIDRCDEAVQEDLTTRERMRLFTDAIADIEVLCQQELKTEGEVSMGQQIADLQEENAQLKREVLD